MCRCREFIAHYYSDGHYFTKKVQLRFTKNLVTQIRQLVKSN